MRQGSEFFLIRRAIYVVTVDGRDDRYQREAEYWLKLVRACSTNCGERLKR